MFFIAGDIHGDFEVYKVLDFFRKESEKKKLTESDYLILLGDVGVCFDGGKKDEAVRRQLELLPVTVLWIDGNHENFQIVSKLPISSWKGGEVQFIGDKIIHLMRGNVYDIDGTTFFTMGGGYSIDKSHRIENVDWWADEMPSLDEYERGMANLKAHNNQVDYILTHTAPKSIAGSLVKSVMPGEEVLQDYLEDIATKVTFKKWFFGHWHLDKTIDKFVGVYDKVWVI